MRGPDFFIDLLDNKAFAETLLGIVTDPQIRMLENLLKAVGDYTEVVVLSDDLGTQMGPFLSIETYRELIKPCHKKLCDRIKAQTDIKVKLHSCGNVYSYLPDFIDAGIDILNPVQVPANDMQTDRLKREFGDRLCFWGAVDAQHVLPFGELPAVEAEVKRRLADLAPGGFYILAPSHNIQAGVPPENVVRIYDSVAVLGRYKH